MNYKEAVKEELQEENLKNLWEEITAAYEEGRVEEIIKRHGKEIVNEFNKLLNSLETKL